jgi:hypothetical protein
MLNVKRKIVNVRRKKFLTALVVLSLCMAFNVMAEDMIFAKHDYFKEYREHRNRKHRIRVSFQCAVVDPSAGLSDSQKILVKKLTLRRVFKGQLQRLDRKVIRQKLLKKIQTDAKKDAEKMCRCSWAQQVGDTEGIKKFCSNPGSTPPGSTPGCEDFDSGAVSRDLASVIPSTVMVGPYYCGVVESNELRSWVGMVGHKSGGCGLDPLTSYEVRGFQTENNFQICVSFSSLRRDVERVLCSVELLLPCRPVSRDVTVVLNAGTPAPTPTP